MTVRALLVPLLLLTSLPALGGESAWSGYLDYAYVYSSAEPDALRQRLDQYGQEAGIRLDDYLAVSLNPGAAKSAGDPDTVWRRAAIGHLLLYLAQGDADQLNQAVGAIGHLSGDLEQSENRFWHHYILAHRALERDQRYDFVGELLDLWLHVIVPLETPYETLQTLSLSDAPNSGFLSALPYLYESVSRLILIRSQQMGVQHGLDPLAALVRLLYDGRVGAHPEVIPVELSSRAYLERIVTRLDGTESDAGSLSFTLALFEASKYHDEARAKLAEQGLDPETVKALRVASGAYQGALDQAKTLQGEAAVYTRVLGLLGEVYAAKQRLGVDPDIESPFSIESAIEVYGKLKDAEQSKELDENGYGNRKAYLSAMHRLWEEIQETSLNAADYYLTRAVEQRNRAQDYARNAAGIYARYLAFFHRFATGRGRDTVPDSAFFAAYEAARGYGDSLLTYSSGNLSRAELEQSTQRYVGALHLFPFDRQLWPALSSSLSRLGRENDYLDLARPVAEAVATSRQVDGWIRNREPGYETISVIRRALSDSQVLVYLGFAEAGTVDQLESSLAELRAKRDEANAQLASMTAQRASLGRSDSPPAAPDPDVRTAAAAAVDVLQVEALDRQIDETRRSLTRLEKQLEARTTALPLFKATLGTESFVDELRARRDHPAHSLLRRMFYENRS